MIDITPRDLETVQRLLAAHFPQVEARVFGSRYHWTAKDYSDLDLALVGEQKLDRPTLHRLRESLAESDLPFRVDVLDWHAISPEFQQVIEAGYEVIQERGVGVSSKWQECPFEEVIDFQEGPGILAKDFRAEGVPLIRLAGLGRGASLLDGCNYLDPEFVERRYAHFKVKSGDILLSTSASLGRTAVVDEVSEGCIVYTGIIRMRPSDKRLYAPFILYLLESPNFQEQIEAMGAGSVIRHFGPSHLRQMTVRIPPLPTQRRIADILSALDDKIELNRQTNATLEAIAQAIFKEWFVNFNFPLASLASTGSANEPPSELVEGKGPMQESELGPIPVGWRVAVFEEELDAERGLSYKGAGLEIDNAMPMHNLNSVYEGGGYKFEGIKYYSGEYKEKHIIKPGDLIITNTEQGHKFLLIGYPAIVPSLFGEIGIYSHHIYRVRPKPHSYLTSDFLYQLLLQPEIRDQVVGFSNGTTVNMLKIQGLQKPKFVLPPKELVSKFSELALNIRLKQEEFIKQSTTLAQIRDALLPKLMRGEIEL